MEEFSHIFEGVDDPRRSNATRHDLHEMLMIGLLCTLSGGEGCCDMSLFAKTKEPFLRTFMSLKHGIPSHDAFSDLFNALDPKSLHKALFGFVEDFSDQLGDVIAVDGKTLRRSFDRAKARSALHLVQAFSVKEKLVLGQVAVDEKSNEITALPALLEMLSLKGRIVTADAMHTQRNTAQSVTDAGGDYALALKRNQGSLYEDVKLYLDDRANTQVCDTAEEISAGHGRIETRTALISHDVEWLMERHDWPGLQAIAKVSARREIGDKISHHERYFLLSTPVSAKRTIEITRAHWAIENSLHWVLDVTMNEDAARNRTGNGPENFATLRRMALNLAQTEPSKGSKRGKLKRAGWNDEFMLDMIRAAKNSQKR